MWSLLLLLALAKDVRRKATCLSHSPGVWESSKPMQLLRTMTHLVEVLALIQIEFEFEMKTTMYPEMVSRLTQ